MKRLLIVSTMIGYALLICAGFALGNLGLGPAIAKAAHGSEYHISDVVMHPASPSGPAVVGFYQGGYADCGADHNVCWFEFNWSHSHDGWIHGHGWSSHDTDAGGATGHCHVAATGWYCSNQYGDDFHYNWRGSGDGLCAGWIHVWAYARAWDGSQLDADPDGWELGSC